LETCTTEIVSPIRVFPVLNRNLQRYGLLRFTRIKAYRVGVVDHLIPIRVFPVGVVDHHM
jgi:hypothetical protein